MEFFAALSKLLEATNELRADLKAHVAQEGQEVEVRTASGSWRDVEDYFADINLIIDGVDLVALAKPIK